MTENIMMGADRPALPRDAFRDRRTPAAETVKPVVVTPDYDESTTVPQASRTPVQITADADVPRQKRARTADGARNPFDAYGERTSSRPYALRLPDAVDLVVRQLAAENRTHPLRIIDRILYDHLKSIGRLPPPRGA